MKKSKHECDNTKCFMCQNCLPEWHPAIASNKKNFKVKKGEVIFKEGDEVKGVYFMYDGIVKVHKKWGDDKELIIRFATEGAIFGHRGLGNNNVYPISATALEAGVVCFVDLDFFKSTLHVNHKFTFDLLMFFASELQEAESKMRNLAHMSVKGRVARALLILTDQFGTTDEGFINIELTRQDLAAFAGATYETVFRVINELLREDLIKVSGKKIAIENYANLELLTSDASLQL